MRGRRYFNDRDRVGVIRNSIYVCRSLNILNFADAIGRFAHLSVLLTKFYICINWEKAQCIFYFLFMYLSA